jgi:hypothetical protein
MKQSLARLSRSMKGRRAAVLSLADSILERAEMRRARERKSRAVSPTARGCRSSTGPTSADRIRD